MFLFKPKSETFHIVHQNNKNQQLPWLGIMSITRPTQEWQWRNILNPASVSLKLTFIVYVIVIFPIQGILHECIERKTIDYMNAICGRYLEYVLVQILK